MEEEPGRLQSIVLQRVRHEKVTFTLYVPSFLLLLLRFFIFGSDILVIVVWCDFLQVHLV